jgi:hypothetical protein
MDTQGDVRGQVLGSVGRRRAGAIPLELGDAFARFCISGLTTPHDVVMCTGRFASPFVVNPAPGWQCSAAV